MELQKFPGSSVLMYSLLVPGFRGSGCEHWTSAMFLERKIAQLKPCAISDALVLGFFVSLDIN